MNGSVLFEGNPILSGSLNVNTGGNIEPLEVEINENGTREITPPSGVDGYAPITIETNVPQVVPILETLNVTQNGTYTPPTGTDGYDEIVVNVPPITPVLDDITITENGTYTPPTGTDGYNDITVNVPLPENAYLLEEYEDVPTDIASFTASDAPLKSLTASIVPVQAGSGDPSPTNVRPISGWTEEVITRTGKNLLNYPNIATQTYRGITVSKGTDGYTFDGTSTGDICFCLTNEYITNYYLSQKLTNVIKMKRGTYTISGALSPSNTEGNLSILYGTNVGGEYNTSGNSWATIKNTSITVTFDSEWYITPLFSIANGKTVSSVVGTIQLELGTTATTYEPYAGTTYTIPFTDGQGQSVEVFGGSVDIVNGVVTPCPYYASYNGEQLTGEWISDRDVYTPNTTPTIGAQVVNIGATDTSFSTQPTSIKSLDGVNNVWASTGQIENLEFFTKEE